MLYWLHDVEVIVSGLLNFVGEHAAAKDVLPSWGITENSVVVFIFIVVIVIVAMDGSILNVLIEIEQLAKVHKAG